MNDNLMSYIYLVSAPLFSSFFYLQLKDIYKIYVLKKTIYMRDLNWKSLINPGLGFGLVVSLTGYLVGFPIIPNLYKLVKN